MSGSPECSLGMSVLDALSPGFMAAWNRRISAFLFALCFCLATPVVQAEEPQLRIGWQSSTARDQQGSYVVGNWTEAAVDLDVAEQGSHQVRVTALDPDGNRVTFTSAMDVATGRQTLRGYFKSGLFEPVQDVSVFGPSGKLVWSSSAGPSVKRLAVPIDPGIRLIATVGNPAGFDWTDEKLTHADKSGTSRTVAVDVKDLPIESRAYDSISMLVVAGKSVLTAVQADAVRDWVAAGGRLLISLPHDPKQAQSIVQPYAAWLPARVGNDPVTISEFGKLESYARKNVRIPFTGRMPISSVKITQGEVLAGSRDDALLVRAPYGIGSVTILALDATQTPLNKWTEISSLARRLTEVAETLNVGSSSPRTSQLSSTGISDFSTQLHAVQEDFAGIDRASPWFVMGLLVALLLLIGPIDYLIIHRVLKRPRATWITFPIWIGLATLLAASLANSWNGTKTRINELNIVDIDVATSTCHQRLWTNVYSPATERQSVTIQSKIAPDNATQHTGWSGVAETAYGGMLRPANVQVGMAEYDIAEPTSLKDLPLLQWSSKALATEVHSPATGLVESTLQSNGIGQLSGTIMHRLPGTIEDWILVFGSRVYRHKKTREDITSLPLATKQILRVDQPNVFPRDLRAFLTGRTNVSSQASDAANQFVSYDSMSRDPAEALRIMTFHNEVGGTKYTGLTNRLLEKEDLSHLLKLGRAVLFGRLDASVASVQMNGTDVAPNRESTFIRLVLPVTKVGSDNRTTLERLDK